MMKNVRYVICHKDIIGFEEINSQEFVTDIQGHHEIKILICSALGIITKYLQYCETFNLSDWLIDWSAD